MILFILCITDDHFVPESSPWFLGHPPSTALSAHDDVIKGKHFPRYWSFVRGIHRWPVNSPHKGQRRGALVFSLIYAWMNGWINNRETGDLRRHRAYYDVTVMGINWVTRNERANHPRFLITVVLSVYTLRSGTCPSLSSHCNSFEDWVTEDIVCRSRIFKWLATTRPTDWWPM